MRDAGYRFVEWLMERISVFGRIDEVGIVFVTKEEFYVICREGVWLEKLE